MNFVSLESWEQSLGVDYLAGTKTVSCNIRHVRISLIMFSTTLQLVFTGKKNFSQIFKPGGQDQEEVSSIHILSFYANMTKSF